MNSRNIGKIVSINVKGIIAEIYEDIGNYINTIDGVCFVGEVGSYVSIYELGRTIIAEIVGVEEKIVYGSKELNKPNSCRNVNLELIGEIINNSFYFGVSKMPLIFSEINIISEKDLTTMLEVGEEEIIVNDGTGNTRALLLPIGKSVVFPDYSVRVNIDKFFGFHFAVFGNTGAGKSNTIARIIQNIFSKTQYAARGAKFIIIDSNGEYCQAFSDIHLTDGITCKQFSCDEESENQLELPVWALSVDDWAVLLHASEKTQIPVLKRALDIAKIFYDEEGLNADVKNHILASTLLGIINSSDTSPSKSDKLMAIISQFGTNEINMTRKIDDRGNTLSDMLKIDYGSFIDEEGAIDYFNHYINNEIIDSGIRKKNVAFSLEQFVEAVNFAMLYEGSISSQRIQEYTATLTTRLQAIQEGIQGKFLTETEHKSVEEYIDNLIGQHQIIDIDVSGLDDSTAEVVTKVLSKLLFDYLKQREIKADMPVNLIIEEAHRFVKNETNYGAVGYNIFERISKEGRKYGLLLGISSQRPSELSKTVVSQCSNFIIHRVQNPDDLQYISRMVPYINQGMINRLTYLQTGHALVFGTAINLPTLTHIQKACPQTDSDNARISEKWYVE